MELLNRLNVPVSDKAMTAVNLQRVGLISVLLLQKVARIVVILEMCIARLNHVDGWSIWQTFYFVNVSSDIGLLLNFGFVLSIELAQNCYMESFWMCSKSD